MSNEFVARKGLISLQTSSFKEDVYISGSLRVGTFATSSNFTVSGSAYISRGLTVDGGITGSLYGTSSWAVSASWAPTAISASYVSGSMTGSLSASYIDFLQTPDLANQIGRLQWDSDLGTLKLTLRGGNVTVPLGFDEVAYVYNAEATTLNKGEVVYVSGSNTDRIAVKRASATGDSTSARTLGIVAESIASSQSGYVTTRGLLRDVNTNGYNAGDTLYLSTASGQFTNIKPQAPIHMVYVGFVARVGTSNGIIFTMVQNGYELDEIHDVRINNKAAGDLLVYSSSGLWENTKTLVGNYTVSGSINVSGGVTGSLFGTSSYAISSATSSYVQFTNYNVRLANGAGNSLSSGYGVENTFIGRDAGGGVNNGSQNIYIGSYSGYSNNGVYNVNIGHNAGAMGVGNENVFVGNNTGGTEGSGTGEIRRNVSIGSYAGSKLGGTGRSEYNTLVGYFAARYLESGSNNTVLGNNAGYSLYQNYGNTIIGANVDVGEANNTIAIGDGQGNIRYYVNSVGNTAIGKTSPINAKLDVLGDVAITGSLRIFGSITGSLLGTSSYALNALTSSYISALAQSLKITGSVDITGSLYLTGSFNASTDANVMGNLGVGTSSPFGRLHAEWSVDGQTGGVYVRNTNGGTSAYGGIYLGNNSSGTEGFIGVLGSANSGNYGGSRSMLIGLNSTSPIVFMTAGTEKVRIDSDGKVGIGVKTPSTKLHVSGSITADGGGTESQVYVNNGANTSYLFNSTTAIGLYDSTNLRFYNVYDRSNNSWAFYTSGSVKLYINSSGNVGIGNTNPGQLLTVGTNFSPYSTSQLSVSSGGNNSFVAVYGNNSAGLYLTNPSRTWAVGAGAASGGDKFEIYDGGNYAYRLVINSSGNVGIGTTTPNVKLEVIGSVIATGSFTARDATEAQVRLSGGSNLSYVFNTSTAFGFYDSTNSRHMSYYDRDTNDWRFFTSGTQRMIISGSGNVGIGTSTPNEKLEVAGNIRLASAGYIDYVSELRYVGSAWLTYNTGTGKITVKNASGNGVAIDGGNVTIGKQSAANAALDIVGNTIITGSLTVTAPITASSLVVTNLYVTTISSSVVYSSGSNTFGNLSTDKHQFTGSVQITGSLTSNGLLTAATMSVSTLLGNVNISGSLTTTGLITAPSMSISNLLVTTISSAVLQASGSNIFGGALTDKQQFTGSVDITGSLAVSGTIYGSLQGTSSVAISSSYATTASYTSTASYIDGGFY